MTPLERTEVESVARQCEAFGLHASAARLRALLPVPVVPDRLCPVQDREGRPKAIPWGLAEILYPAYGHGQTLERLAERGGFGWGELGALAADDYSRGHPRLKRPPLLDIYEMAVSASAVSA